MNPVSDFIQMRADLARARPDVDIWGAVLNVPLLLGGAFFIAHIEGQLVLGTEILALLVAGQIHKRRPLSRLIGICHIVWLPLIPFLLHRVVAGDLRFWLRSWVALSLVLISACVVMDAFDLYRYLRTNNKTYVRPAA